jgi:hypothetical protein
LLSPHTKATQKQCSMTSRILPTAALLATLAVPFAAQAQSGGAAAGATTGAVTGAIIGGPVGAAVGAVGGVVVGGLGRVDGFDDDEAQSECDEGCEVLVRFLATERKALEALELADEVFDAGAGAIERLREEGRLVLGR